MHKLKPIRVLLGVTQREVAAGIGCRQSNVANYEKGQSIPVPMAQRLIDFARKGGLEISLDHIYGLKPLPQALAQPTQEAA